MSDIQGVVFDFDGVLFASKRANLAYYNVILKEFNVPPVNVEDEAQVFLCHTANSARVFEVLLGPERVKPAMEFAARLGYRQFMPYMDMEPKLVPALKELAAKVALGVATNRGKSTFEILSYFDLARYFKVVVTCQDVSQPKPDPEMLLLAARRMKINKENLLYVGDSELDRQAADRAGILFAAYKGEVQGSLAIGDHSEIAFLLKDSSERNLTISKTLPFSSR
jgi:HAD superfamily hydrolase (TIGR01549 family)